MQTWEEIFCSMLERHTLRIRFPRMPRMKRLFLLAVRKPFFGERAFVARDIMLCCRKVLLGVVAAFGGRRPGDLALVGENKVAKGKDLGINILGREATEEQKIKARPTAHRTKIHHALAHGAVSKEGRTQMLNRVDRRHLHHPLAVGRAKAQIKGRHRHAVARVAPRHVQPGQKLQVIDLKACDPLKSARCFFAPFRLDEKSNLCYDNETMPAWWNR